MAANDDWFKFDAKWWQSGRIQLRPIEEQAALVSVMSVVWLAGGSWVGTLEELAHEAMPVLCENEGDLTHAVALIQSLIDHKLIKYDSTGTMTADTLLKQRKDINKYRTLQKANAQRRWNETN